MPKSGMEGGFSLVRVSTVVVAIAAAAYYTPPNVIENINAQYPNLVLYIVAFFAAKDYIIPSVMTWCFVGPPMSTRRKTMAATWEPAGRTGEIYSVLEFDMTRANKYMADVSFLSALRNLCVHDETSDLHYVDSVDMTAKMNPRSISVIG